MTQLEQPFHILRKDAKHLWPELTLHTVLLIAFAWIVPLGWPPHEAPTPLFQVLPVFLHLLLPILWLVLISRLVHDESLVGDQQFWLTRPYTWPALLASKALFLITFIFVPFLAMQCYLLFHAGLHPFASLPGLLLNLLYLILLCFLPFFVLASVTSTFPRLALAIIEAILYLIVLALLIGKLFNNQTAPPLALPIFVGLYALCLLAVLVLQYAKRLTLYARLSLIATPLLIAGLFVALPSTPLFLHAYPLASSPRISFDPTASQPDPDPTPLFRFDNKVMVNLPMQIDVGSGDRLEDRAATFTLDSTSGPAIHYVSPWSNAHLSENSLSLTIPEELINHLQNNPVRLHITFAAERFAPSPPTTVTAKEHFTAPGEGACSLSPDSDRPICNFALHSPPLTFYSGPFSTQPCSIPSTPATSAIGRGGFPLHPPQFPSLDPVVQTVIGLQDPRSNPDEPTVSHVCAGAPITFNQLHYVGNLHVDIDTPPIQLSRYLVHRGQGGMGGVTFHVTHPQ
jgi:hypothetical protein